MVGEGEVLRGRVCNDGDLVEGKHGVCVFVCMCVLSSYLIVISSFLLSLQNMKV